MAVPVVHVILRHVVDHARIIRNRDRMDSTIHTDHDLFDHWSAIVCGVGSVVAIVAAIVFTVLLCVFYRKPR